MTIPQYIKLACDVCWIAMGTWSIVMMVKDSRLVKRLRNNQKDTQQ